MDQMDNIQTLSQTWTQTIKSKKGRGKIRFVCIKQHLSNIWGSIHENV